MRIISNPWRKDPKGFDLPDNVPAPSIDAQAPLALLKSCPAAHETPLLELTALANQFGIAAILAKDERGRMGLGSFKALGAAYVLAHHAIKADAEYPETALEGQTWVTASAGNHGLSVAAGARLFGAKAVIYLSNAVPQSFAERLEAKGVTVVRAGRNYEESMAAARQAAETEDMILLSDSSWPGYYDLPHRLMEGYLVMAHEIGEQMLEPPTHIFLQAGVGGLAGACAAWFRQLWGDAPTIIIVEPDAAPALQASIEAGRMQPASGPVSNMGRLDCKEASLIALKGLCRDADWFVTISDEAAQKAVEQLADYDIETSPSAAAGFAALADADARRELGMDANSRALVIISEGAAP